MRQLATVRSVSALRDIPGADKIELALVDGWQCVVKKGAFFAGDRGLFLEIDSFIPESDDRFAFLGKAINWKDKRGYRLRTMRLRKTLSQGLLLPLNDFPEVVQVYSTRVLNEDGSDPLDLAAVLGIEKWEREMPACLAGQVKGNFPSFLRKTDQERIQNMTRKLDDIYSMDFEVTMKLDGSSMTSYIRDEDIGVCSRNLDLKLDDESSTFVQVFKRDAHEAILKDLKEAFGFNIAMQGELMGPGIQGNRENFPEHRFFVFDLFNIDEGKYIEAEPRHKAITWIQQKAYNIDHVPVIYCNSDEKPTFIEIGLPRAGLMEIILMMANGESINNPVREGIVFKALDAYKENGHIFSFKAISNEFLEQGGD